MGPEWFLYSVMIGIVLLLTVLMLTDKDPPCSP